MKRRKKDVRQFALILLRLLRMVSPLIQQDTVQMVQNDMEHVSCSDKCQIQFYIEGDYNKFIKNKDKQDYFRKV